MTNPPLRIGLLLNVGPVPRWVKVLVDELQSGDYCTIVLKIYDNGAPRAAPKGNTGVLENALLNTVKFIHNKIAEGPSRLEDAFTPCDITEQLDDVATLNVDTQRRDIVDTLTEADIQSIDAYKLDVVIRLGFGILCGEILQLPKHGVWSLHYGDSRVHRGGPPAFWETLQSWSTAGSMLQRLTGDINNGLILSYGYAPVDRFSLAHTKNNLYWKSQAMISRELQRLHRLGEDAFFDKNRLPKKSSFEFYSKPMLKAPTAKEHLKLTVKKLVEKTAYVTRNKRYLDQWVLLYQFSDNVPSSPRHYTTLSPPKEYLWADPFPIERNGRYYIYFEEYPYAVGKGHISVIELKKDGSITKPEPV